MLRGGTREYGRSDRLGIIACWMMLGLAGFLLFLGEGGPTEPAVETATGERKRTPFEHASSG